MIAHLLLCNQDDDEHPVKDSDEPWFEEMASLFRKIGYSPVVHVLRLDNYEQKLTAIGPLAAGDIILHSCDGIESQPYVRGADVADWLTRANLPFIGASAEYDRISADKRLMKQKFAEHQVPTAPFVLLDGWQPAVPDLMVRRGLHYPVFVKLAKYCSSWGIARTSKAEDAPQVCNEVARLSAEFGGEILIEEFIVGTEYCCLVFDGESGPQALKPAIRHFRFCPESAQAETFYASDDVDFFFANGEMAIEFLPVEDALLAQQIMDVSVAAYRSIGGTGWGRVDLRRQDSSGEVMALEVNASPGIGSNTFCEKLLTLNDMSWEDFFRRIIAGFHTRNRSAIPSAARG